MNSRLRQASECEIINWFEKTIVELSAYQKERLHDDEKFRIGPFFFYCAKNDRKPVTFLWRLTYLIFLVYLIMMWVILPVFFLFTGKWIYPQWVLDKIHYPWCRKLNLDL